MDNHQHPSNENIQRCPRCSAPLNTIVVHGHEACANKSNILSVVLAMFAGRMQILIQVTSVLNALFPFCLIQLGTALVWKLQYGKANKRRVPL